MPVLSILFLLFLFFSAFNSSPITPQNTNPQSPPPGGPTKVHIEAADSGEHDQERIADVEILYGNVIFRHDSTMMYCDSAYINKTTNSLEAFSNVRMIQGDTLFVYGNYLKYNGNTQLAILRKEVRMSNKNVTLSTDSLNYDRLANIGYFFNGGKIVDEQNTLTSQYGQYSPGTKQASFKHTVKLVNPKFVLTSDTLNYGTDSKTAIILGPSVIESDSGTIYSEKGWYNTTTQESRLFNRSTVVSKDRTKFMTADSLYYNLATGFTEAFGDMFLNDTVKKVILTGNYGFFDDMKNNAMATDSAQFIEYSKGDSLFLHGDTLKMQTVGKDEREIKAYHGVRFFRTDLQGVCDSMQFNTRDSVLYMYTDPILWNTGYQMTGDTIQVLFNDSTIEKVHVINYAFASEEMDTTYYNQLKGRNLIANFTEGELSFIYVSGNAETAFYPSEKDGSFTGMNRTISSYFTIEIKDKKPSRMVFWPEPKGSMTPLPDLTPELKFLDGFVDFNYLRPAKQTDIFLNIKKKEVSNHQESGGRKKSIEGNEN